MMALPKEAMSVIEDFVKITREKFKQYYYGALVCGSPVTGVTSCNSGKIGDIDITIIVNDLGSNDKSSIHEKLFTMLNLMAREVAKKHGSKLDFHVQGFLLSSTNEGVRTGNPVIHHQINTGLIVDDPKDFLNTMKRMIHSGVARPNFQGVDSIISTAEELVKLTRSTYYEEMKQNYERAANEVASAYLMGINKPVPPANILESLSVINGVDHKVKEQALSILKHLDSRNYKTAGSEIEKFTKTVSSLIPKNYKF